MKRLLSTGALLCLIFTAAAPTVHGQGKESKVLYSDRETQKPLSVSGIITDESPAEIVVKANKGPQSIPAIDVIDVEYPASNTVSVIRRKALNSEKDGKFEDALKLYNGMIKDATDKSLKRHVEFKIAQMTAKLAEGDRAQVKAAIDLLAKFQKKHPDSWEIVNMPKLLVPLYQTEGNTDGALESLDSMLKQPKLSNDLKMLCHQMRVKVLMDSKKYTEAAASLRTLIKGAKPKDPSTIRSRIMLSEVLAAGGKLPEATKELQGIIDETANADMKAMGYNALGDCYRLSKDFRSAMWSYLFVWARYNQNKEEVAKANFYLYKVFKELKQEEKAKQHRKELEADTFPAAAKYKEMLKNEK